MHFGYQNIDDLVDGFKNLVDSKGYNILEDFRGAAVSNVTGWQCLDLSYETIASIDVDKCIECGLCHIVCEDTSHQAILASKDTDGKRSYTLIDDECVGCNLCGSVCPVPDCISMVAVDDGKPHRNWGDHPNNPQLWDG